MVRTQHELQEVNLRDEAVMMHPPCEGGLEEANWWAWVAFAHTVVDALLYLPWHQFLLWLVQTVQRRANGM